MTETDYKAANKYCEATLAKWKSKRHKVIRCNVEKDLRTVDYAVLAEAFQAGIQYAREQTERSPQGEINEPRADHRNTGSPGNRAGGASA